jgi:IS30 family transposase
VISHESIYKWIYDEGKQLKLHHYLIRRKRKRGSRPCKKAKLSKIPNRISIHDRPKEHDTTFGHWEGDTIIFAQGKGAIVTLYERQSKLTLAEKVSQKTASLVTQVLEAMLSNLPEEARKSITFDNGGEFTDHEKLIHLLEDKTYFCDSYASWQKGGVENANGIIRRDIPKGSLQQNYTERDIHMIIEDINNMPRKSIGFLTPVEKFNALCKNQHSLHYPLINNLVALRV